MESQKSELSQQIENSILGFVIGDALGVPVEFHSRHYLKENPITDMIGFGSHNQPAGTWSDDTSLTLCLMESLNHGFNLNDIADNFIQWLDNAHWTAHGEVFDVGNTTYFALNRIKYQNIPPENAGGAAESDNGNGALMRMLPLAFYLKDLPIQERFETVKLISSITHKHIRSIIACFYYIEFAIGLLNKENKFKIYQQLKDELPNFFKDIIDQNELLHFARLLNHNIHNESIFNIKSDGYCVASLEAVIWCILKNESYTESVLTAVNLGNDTDTIGAMTGGLAGIIYGISDTPKHWIKKIARYEDILLSCKQFAKSINS